MPDMRFAPAPVLLAQTGSGGLNQTNLRSHNERLLLDLLRRGKTLSRFDIGQRSKLSAQTVSVLVRALLAEGLLLEGKAHRGRIGPPTTPFSLNPDGAFAIGIYAGVKVVDICCLDFCGTLRASRRALIEPGASVLELADSLCGALLEELDKAMRSRCLGIGVALNRAHWPSEMDTAQAAQIETLFSDRSGLPCFLLDDVTSAATGEVLFGERDGADQFAFVHVGMHTTIRVVLNGQAQKHHDDRLLPLPGMADLSRRLESAGHSTLEFWANGALPDGSEKIVSDWSRDLADAVEKALIVLLSVLDLPQIVVVSPIGESALIRILGLIADRLDQSEIDIPVTTGHNASFAKASGAASSVLSTRFAPNWRSPD